MLSVLSVLAVVLCVLHGPFDAHRASGFPWPQKDMDAIEINPSLGDSAAVLVAARRSDFKEAVVKRVAEALAGDSVYVKVIGINQLDKQDAAVDHAVVLINERRIGKMDRKVRRYIEKNNQYEGFIVLTTSGDGGWLPDQEGRPFDAISSASEDERVTPVAADIVAEVRLRIRPPQTEQQTP